MCDGKTWGQLAGLTMSKVPGLTDHQALNILRLRLMAGGMGEGDYVTMARLDMEFGLAAEAKAFWKKASPRAR